jgi:TM2 domain-containing membrane protein YozV
VTDVRGSHRSPQSSEVKAFASKKIAAGICGILLGGLGVHKFIIGLIRPGIIMLIVWLVGSLLFFLILPLFATIAMSIIGLVEGIIYLSMSDEDFYQTYAIDKKEWF